MFTKYFFRSDYDDDFWPPHCQDGLYFMPVLLANDIHQTLLFLENSPKSRVPVEILITGIVRRLLGRGDENIQCSFEDVPNVVAFKRFPDLSKSLVRVKEEDRVLELKIFELWSNWYEKLKGVFHVYVTLE